MQNLIYTLRMSLTTVLIISFFILSTLGTIFHFTHSWFKNGLILHIFSAINESTWEHMKMLVAPTLLISIFQYFVIRENYSNLFNGILILFAVEILTIPLIYELLRLLLKKVPFQLTILIFYLSISLGLLSEYYILNNKISIFSELVSLILIGIITLKFAIFTYYPPKIFLFRDPVSGGYGDIHHRRVSS